MKHCILIVGQDLKLNRSLIDYALSEYDKIFEEPPALEFINSNDLNLHFFVENLSFRYNYLTILTTNKSYHIIGKILGTLTNSKLEVINDNLVLNNAIDIQKDSFVIKLNQSELNLIKLTPLNEMPKILLKPKINFKKFFIFDYSLEVCNKMLNPLMRKFEVEIEFSQISKFLIMARITEKKFSQVYEFLDNAREILLNKIILEDSFIEFIIKKLSKKNLTITFAESCTGGLMASSLVKYSGASKVFKGSMVTYSDNVKKEWLNVTEIPNHTAVSKEVVSEMLNSIITLADSDFAIAVSGYADGEFGGDIFIGVADQFSKEIIKYKLHGSRAYIQQECVLIAFCMLANFKSEIFF